MRAHRFTAMLMLVASVGSAAGGRVAAEALYFTGTTGNQVWRASWDGSETPTAVYSPAAATTKGPIGIAWAGPGEPLYFTGGRNEENYVGDEDGAVAPAVLPATTGDLGSQDVRHDVAIDTAGGRLFFTIRNEGIFSCALPCAGAAVTVFPDTGVFIGLEYEPLSDRLYFTRDDGVIGWGPADGGSGPTILFDTTDGVQDDAPRNLILDPSRNRMYWVQHEDGSNGSGEILGANLDGTGTPVVLFTSPDPFLPFGIEIDVLHNRLYWTEWDSNNADSNDRVMVADAGGSGVPSVLYSGTFGSIRGITLGRALSVVEVPSLSGAGLVALGLALAAVGAWGVRTRTKSRSLRAPVLR